MCGADTYGQNVFFHNDGSSPRVRSRRPCRESSPSSPGIISACAEQTAPTGITASRWTDHLRVCGADAVAITLMVWMTGSSPRVRSRRELELGDGTRQRIISACAEQTKRCWNTQATPKDHLRVCGADLMAALCDPFRLGSSPRVRSRQLYFTVVWAGRVSRNI